MIQDLLTNKKYLFASGANTELRAQRNLNRRAVLLNGALVGNVRTEQFGVSARVYENGVYGFSSTQVQESASSMLTTRMGAMSPSACLRRDTPFKSSSLS